MAKQTYTKGGALGSYVHLYWKNYDTYGTHSSSSQTQTENNEQAFRNYLSAVENRISSMPNIYDKLQTASKQFTQGRENIIAAMKQNDALKQTMMEAVVRNADLGANVDISAIARMIQFDIETGSITLPEQRLKEELATFQDYRKINLASGAHYTRLSTLKAYLKSLATLLNRLSQMGAPSAALLQADYQALSSIYDQLDKGTDLLAIAKSLLGEKHGLTNNDFTKKTVPVAIGKILTERMRQLEQTALAADYLAKLRGSFEEVIGTFSSTPVEALAQEAIKDTLTQGMKKSTMQLNAGAQLSLSLDALTFGKNTTINNKNIYVQDQVGDQIRVTYKVDYLTKDKIDFNINIEGRDIGVSAKAVQLQADYFTKQGKQIPASLSLQTGTSLYMYLMAIQRMQQGMGNHFLNVLSTHADGNAPNTMRQQANYALLLTMLYSALTGDITKPHNQIAEILYIYDTSKKLSDGTPRVHFISIKDLLINISKQSQLLQEAVSISPDISSILLQNREEPLNNKTMSQAIAARITRVLEQSRNHKMSIGIKHSALRNYITTYT